MDGTTTDPIQPYLSASEQSTGRGSNNNHQPVATEQEQQQHHEEYNDDHENDNYVQDELLQQNDDDDNNNNDQQVEEEEPKLSKGDEALYSEVLSYLMKGHRMVNEGEGSSSVSHMPRSIEKALGNRHVKVDPEPTDVVQGPVQFIDLPLGLALLFDVATDEMFVERWQYRQLDEFPPPEKPNPSDVVEAARAAAAAGEDASSGNNNNNDSKKDDNNDSKKGDAADGEKDKEDKKKSDEDDKKKDDDDGDKDGDEEDEENDGEGETRSPSKKKKIVEKPEWGGPKPKKAPPQKKYSTLVKPVPKSRGIEYVFTTDVNAEMQLMGPPEWIPYVSYLCSLPPPKEDRCNSLYELGLNLGQELTKKVEDAKKKKAEEELKTCTFKPKVSESASRLPGWKGDMEKFYSDKLEWVKQMSRKLEKKKKKQESEDQELYAQWEMSEKSKKMLERRERRMRSLGLEAGETPPRAADRRGVEVTPDAKKKHTFRKTVAAPEYSFAPVTNQNRHRNLHKNSHRSDSATEDQQSQDAYNFTAILDEFNLPDDFGGNFDDDDRDFLTRMEADYAGRQERRKQRAIQFARQQKEKLFDPVTGQPLFEPNAAPTLVRQDGQRVSYHELSSKERKDFLRKLKQQKRLDFIPGVARDKSDNHKLGEDEMAEMYKRMLDKVKQGTVRIDRIRRKEDQERKKWFRPTIEQKSVSILKVAGRMRKPVYRLPLKRPKTPPPPKPQPKSVASKMRSVVERNEAFHSNKKEALEKKVEEKEEKAKGQHTFIPQVSKASTRIIKERRGQLQHEIAALEEQRRDFYLQRSAEIHFASEIAGGGPLRAAAPIAAAKTRSSASPTAARNVDPNSPVLSQGSGGGGSHQRHKDPQQEVFFKTREQGWHRPDNRNVSSHYYFEPEKTISAQREREAQQRQMFQQRHFGGAAAAVAMVHNQPSNNNIQQQQQQQPRSVMSTEQPGYSSPPNRQQQQQQQQQRPYDDLDDIVGNMLSDSAKRRGGGAGQAHNSVDSYPVSSPQPQPQHYHQQQQHQQAPISSRSNNTNYVAPRLKSDASNSAPAASQSQEGSGRRLQSILASWDDLEKQTAAVL